MGEIIGYPELSLLSVPLVSKQNRVGFLIAYNQKGQKEFSDQDEYYLTALGNITAIAMENARLLERSNIRANALSSLHKLSQSMLTVRVDSRALLEIIAKCASEVLLCDMVVIFEYYQETNQIITPPIIDGKEINDIKRLTQKKPEDLDQDLMNMLIKRKEPFFASNAPLDWIKRGFIAAEKASNTDSFFNREKIISSVGIPLQIEGEVLGLLFVNYRNKKIFFKEDEEIISTFGNQAALAVRNSRFLREEESYIKQLNTLNEISTKISLSENLNIPDLLNLIYQNISKLLSTQNFYIAFYDKKKDLVEFKLAFENGENIKPGIGQWKQRKNGNGLTEYIIRTKKPLLLNNNIAKWFEEHNIEKIGVPTKSFLGIPLISGKDVIGVISIQNTTEENAYGSRDQDILTAIGSHAAIAIRNNQISKNLIHNLNTIDDVVQKISAKVDSKILQEEIVHQIRTRLHCTHCTLYLYKHIGQDEYLIPTVVSGNKKDEKRILNRKFHLNVKEKCSEGLIGYVYEKREPMIFSDAATHPRFAEATKYKNYHERSLLIVPVKSGNNIRGMICADQDSLHWFNKDDLQWVNGLASHVGIAIEKTEALDLLHEIGNKLIKVMGNENIKPVLSELIEGALKLTNMEAGSIYIIDEDGDTIKEWYKYPNDAYMPPPRRNNQGYLSGLTRKVIESKKPIFIPNPESEEYTSPSLRYRRQSIIGLPLLIGESVIGILFLVDSFERYYTDIEKSILITLCNQAAQAIYATNILRQQHALQVNIIRKITRSIPAPYNIENILSKILDLSISLLNNATLAAIVIINADGILSPLVMVGKPVENKYLNNINSDGGIVGYAIKNKITQNIGDVHSDPRYLPLRDDIHSELAIPMMRGDRIIGVLNIEHENERAFTELYQEIGEAIAGFIVVTYENYALYKELNDNIKHLEEKENEIADHERAFVLSGISMDFVHNLSNIAGTIPGWAEMIRFELEDPKPDSSIKIKEYSEKINSNILFLFERAKGILNSDLKNETFDIQEVVESIVAQMELYISPRIVIEERYSNTVGTVLGIKSLLQDAITNLIDNAIKSMSSGGKLSISLYPDPENPEIFICLEVADTGIGIPAEQRKSLFEFGLSTWGGRGYGLWRARMITRNSNGDLYYKPGPDSGSIFIMRLPINHSADENDNQHERQ